jgi:hypothetical protein
MEAFLGRLLVELLVLAAELAVAWVVARRGQRERSALT